MTSDTAADIRVNPEIVRLLRMARRWTQEELSAAAQLSLRTVQRAEQEGNVSVTTLKSLASALEVAASELETRRESALSTRSGPIIGVWCGCGGALIGGAMSLRGQVLSLSAGDITAFEFGITAGLTGAAVGVSCALIGILYCRQLRRDSDSK